MVYQDIFKVILSLFGWKENILYKQHILQCTFSSSNIYSWHRAQVNKIWLIDQEPALGACILVNWPSVLPASVNEMWSRCRCERFEDQVDQDVPCERHPVSGEESITTRYLLEEGFTWGRSSQLLRPPKLCLLPKRDEVAGWKPQQVGGGAGRGRGWRRGAASWRLCPLCIWTWWTGRCKRRCQPRREPASRARWRGRGSTLQDRRGGTWGERLESTRFFSKHFRSEGLFTAMTDLWT